MNKRLILLFTTFVSLLAFSSFSHAAPTDADIKIGLVDIGKIIRESARGEKLKKQLEKQAKEVSSDIEGKIEKWEKSREKFLRQQESLNASTRLEKQEDLRQKKASLEREAADSRRSLQVKEKAGIEEIMKVLQGIISEVGEKEKFTVILEKGPSPVVLYGDVSIDITDTVLERLNDL